MEKIDWNKNVAMFLDIDGVLATSAQHYSNPRKWNPKFQTYQLDKKCVNVFNEVCKIINPIVILSSDWKFHYDLKTINEYFKSNDVVYEVSDYTPDLWGVDFFSLEELEICRAQEILKYVNKHNIKYYIAIDDLDLSLFIRKNFIHTPRHNEGIKQSGVKEKILKLYKTFKLN